MSAHEGAQSVHDLNSERLAEELRGLAIELHRRHYSHVPQWKVSSDPRGALSQIDNMTAGMAGQLEALRSAISWLEPPFVDENTTREELLKRIQFALADVKRAHQDTPSVSVREGM